jgi:glucokinase
VKKQTVKQWIGLDLGGTKIAAAMVQANGRMKGTLKIPTELNSWAILRDQLIRICRELQESYGKAASLGIGSAGPLDAPHGVLLDPTNFGWTSPLRVNIVRELKQALKIPVELENDAAAAVLAEVWKGGGGKNCVVLTLGTGLGVGVVCDGKLLRGGRGLHPEGGHVLLRAGDQSAPCGCGLLGCAEAFLSGKNFAHRAGKILGESGVSGVELAERANRGDVRVLKLFAEYGELLAEYLVNIVVLYYPERVIFTGSFAATLPHFLDATRNRLESLLERRLRTIPLLPELRVSKLGDRAGILGSAYVAMHSRDGKADYALH